MQPKQFPWTKFKSNGKHTLILIQTDNILFKLYQIEKLDLEQIIAVVMIVEYVRCMSLPVNEKMNIAYWMLDIKGAQWNGLKCSEKMELRNFLREKRKMTKSKPKDHVKYSERLSNCMSHQHDCAYLLAKWISLL